MDYTQITTVTNETAFIIASIFVWFTTLLIYVLIGIFTKANAGRQSKRFIETSGFMWGLLAVLFWNALALVIFIIFPVWALFIS